MRLIDADKLEIRKLAEFNDEYGDAIIDRKCAYNATRPHRHGKRM